MQISLHYSEMGIYLITSKRIKGIHMGHRVTQRIITCDECGETPEDGEHLWEMCGEYICSNCIDKDDEDDG